MLARFVLLASLLAASLHPVLAQTAPAQPSRAIMLQRVHSGITALQSWYVPRTGLYRTTGWWNAANAITALSDAMRASESKQYAPILARTFVHAQVVIPKVKQAGALHRMIGSPGFLNRYYDDEGWWALAWIDAYDVTGEARYLAMSRHIFADMAGGWDQTCGGGIWWSKDRNYKNAIANELFFSVAAHLAGRASSAADKARYSDWAAREWSWFKSSGMINAQGLVNDGLTIDPATHACTNNGRTTWTYNQGVIVGALAERSKTVADPELLATAQRIADAALTHLTDSNGILHEPCEPDSCHGGDVVQFKGIFVRNLQALNQRSPSARYRTFFQANADSIWDRDRTPETQFGLVWTGPVQDTGAGPQASALDAIIAAAASQ